MLELDMVAHACNPRTKEAKTGLKARDRLDYTARAYKTTES